MLPGISDGPSASGFILLRAQICRVLLSVGTFSLFISAPFVRRPISFNVRSSSSVYRKIVHEESTHKESLLSDS